MRKDIIEKKEYIEKMICENKSKAYIAKELKCKPETLEKYLRLFGISYSGNMSGKGLTKNREKKFETLTDYLNNSTDIQTNKIRIRLISEGYKEHKCEICGLSIWNNREIPLEVHHIDGDRHNNTIDNFMLLCPNCHAQTNSYRGRNARVSE